MGRMTISASGYGALVSDTTSTSSVAAGTGSVQVLAANDSRLHASIFNDSTANLFLLWGGGVASSTNYTVKIPANGFYELPRINPFIGAVQGCWAAANGAARVTEST